MRGIVMIIFRALKWQKNLKKITASILAAILLEILLFMTCVSVVGAENLSYLYVNEETGINEETGYQLVLEDDAGLLTNVECMALKWRMEPITQYGNVAFKTVQENSSSAAAYAESYYRSKFGTASGTLFLIDMDNRKIWIWSDGAVYKVITQAYAETITDNVYQYAHQGDYYLCGCEVYDEIYALLKGDRIAQPMKYISNLLLALILALLVNFMLASYMSKLRAPYDNEILENASVKFSNTPPVPTYKYETRHYEPASSGGGGRGGGGRSGGGHSGGGGGHSF